MIRLSSLNNHQYDKITNSNQNIPAELITIWFLNRGHFTKSRKSKINRKCYRKCDFQAFDWLKFTLRTDLRLTTFCEIEHRTLPLHGR